MRRVSIRKTWISVPLTPFEIPTLYACNTRTGFPASLRQGQLLPLSREAWISCPKILPLSLVSSHSQHHQEPLSLDSWGL